LSDEITIVTTCIFFQGPHSQSSIVILMLQVSAVAISLIVEYYKVWNWSGTW